jgi:REase_DpnII-MboI
MTLVEELLLGDAEKALQKTLKPLCGKGNLDEAFVAWLLSQSTLPFELEALACQVAEHIGGQRRYQDVAILGFAAASGLLSEEKQIALKEGLIWILGREPLINGQLQGFCTNAIALLGISLGVQSLPDSNLNDPLKQWLSQFITQSFQARLPDWQQCLLVAICQVGKVSLSITLSDNQALADVRVALLAKGCLPNEVPVQSDDYIQTLMIMKREDSGGLGCDRAALRLSAYNAIQNISPVVSQPQASVEDVVKILRRVPAAFRRWTWETKGKTKNSKARKWEIDNEYHVQNFLYFLLVPYFPDLQEEEYTLSIGQMHPRADLVIPSLKLVIEVKFMRQRDKPQKMIEQIAADASLYLAEGSAYHQILAFIWDDSCRSEEHDYMCRGIGQLSGITDSIIISRPGNLV